MNTNSNFKIISAGPPLSAAFEQRLLALQAAQPQKFLSALVVQMDNNAELDLDFFEQIVSLYGLDTDTTGEPSVIYTRVESRADEAPQISVLLPYYLRDRFLVEKNFGRFMKARAATFDLDFELDHAQEEDPPSTPPGVVKTVGGEPDETLSANESGQTDRVPRVEVVDDVETLAVREETARLFDPFALDEAIKREEQKRKNDQVRLGALETMHARGPDRKLTRAPEAWVLEDLRVQFPNFSQPIDVIIGNAALSRLSDASFQFQPLLLLGPPGIGKTYLASKLSLALGLSHMHVSMENVQAGWVLTGSSAGWSSAEIGRVGDCLIRATSMNPIIVLDEVDKVMRGSYNPLAPLYSLLEAGTAKSFREEFLALDLNASHVNWILTANCARDIPAPLLTRMNVFEVPAPTHDESLVIAQQIYRDVKNASSWGIYFDEEAHPDVVEKLLAHPPRRMRSLVHDAFGRAAVAGRRFLASVDVVDAAASTQSIGFLQHA